MLIRHRIAGGLAALATAAGLLGGVAASAQAAGSHGPAARTVQSAQCCSMHLEAWLHGSSAYLSVRGHADYQSYGYMNLSLWNAGRLAGRTLVVYVHGTRVGTMLIWSSGSGRFFRSSGVPRCWPGTVIWIRTGSGALVASGTFYRYWMMR